MKISTKKIFLVMLTFICSATFYAQSLSYSDFGILSSQENYRGTARFNAMSGAFGALGGDVSALYLNPAGGVVFSNSTFSGTLSNNSIDTRATYYGINKMNYSSHFRAPQFGAVFIYENPNYRSSWNKFAIGINYSLTNDFKNTYNVKGNNNFATFVNHPKDNRPITTEYINAEKQSFTNDTNGYANVYTFSFSAAYEETLSVGAAINSHHLDFTQNTYLKEQNGDGNGNTLFADYSQYLSELSNGVSLNIGIIAKPTQNLRFGLALQSPIWYYDINEESNITDVDGFEGNTIIDASDINNRYANNANEYTALRYKLNTAPKLTTSIAYIFNQYGLISVDYSFKNYRDIKLSGNSDFSGENESFKSILNKNANTIKIGTEWRLKQWSFRGGYSYKQNAFARNISTDDMEGFSFGLGLKIKNTNFDISYEKTSQTDYYDFYGQYQQINAAKLDFDRSKITATLSFTL